MPYYFTKEQLTEANNLAWERNYNRKLPKEDVENLPSDVKFPINIFIPHSHAQFVEVPPHMRCIFIFEEQSLAVDTDLNVWDQVVKNPV